MKLTLPLVLTAFVLTGCGGEGLSKDDYVSQAEAICQRANDQLNALEVPTTPEAFQGFFDEGLSIVEGATGELEDLEGPSDDADDLKSKLTDPLSKQAQVLRDLTPQVEDAIESDDPEQAFPELGDPSEDAGPDAEADGPFLDGYGLAQCSELAS